MEMAGAQPDLRTHETFEEGNSIEPNVSYVCVCLCVGVVVVRMRVFCIVSVCIEC